MIVLDTHALLWWVSSPQKVPRKAERLISAAMADKTVAVSAISVWEIAMLVERKRLELTMPVDVWLGHVEVVPWLTFIPVDNATALRSVMLPDFPHRDPADRIIVATTLGLNATLITADSRLRKYASVRSAWD